MQEGTSKCATRIMKVKYKSKGILESDTEADHCGGHDRTKAKMQMKLSDLYKTSRCTR
jgi:hypothetical protein